MFISTIPILYFLIKFTFNYFVHDYKCVCAYGNVLGNQVLKVKVANLLQADEQHFHIIKHSEGDRFLGTSLTVMEKSL